MPGSLSFRQNVDLQRRRLKETVRAEDPAQFFAYVGQKKAAQALGSIQQTSAAGVRLAISDVEGLKKIIEKAATDQQEAFNKFTDEVMNLRNDPSIKNDKPAWEEKITEKKDALVKDVSDKIDKMTDDTVKEIEQLPPQQQDAAGDIALNAIDLVGSLFITVVEQARRVLDLVRDFLKGIWKGLQGALRTVINAVKCAVIAISGLFEHDENMKQWDGLDEAAQDFIRGHGAAH
ncbi:hypothetical protein B0I35DRAFT_441053 [Stachybotrys elegans]|uniref:Uncharacterized protein n=1 Tax=Stachybotrys elegans TaxID=80388 RepID=A0A8K0SLD5_9HYPO|nr:hypothetical protein B0I35DRAFT_441053 [Stachybotrys elegans]